MPTTSIQHKDVALSHGRTHYLEAGEGPPVILLHGAGFPSGADSWLANIPGLSTRFRVLAPDCLGWGAGDQLDLGYSFAYLVDHVREFQDALDLERSHVVGHSMGGWIASLLAYESPDRVDRLVLVASGGMATRPLGTMQSWQAPGEEDIRRSLGGLQRAGVDIEPLVKEKVRLAEDGERGERFRRLMDHMTNPETRQRYYMARRLPHIKSPTLILWGSNDPVNNIEMAENTEKLIPDSRLVVFEETGHGVPTERVEEFNQAVEGFLLG
jgi:pimeloyl-ACP methyl ester carboxylesterase